MHAGFKEKKSSPRRKERGKAKDEKTIMVVGVTLAALAGCQSSGNQQVAGQAMAVKKAGEKLGGGFTAGMTPEMTCQVFNKYYKIRHSSNTLCRKVSGSGANSSSEFANAGHLT
jgi:hypothetical protein